MQSVSALKWNLRLKDGTFVGSWFPAAPCRQPAAEARAPADFDAVHAPVSSAAERFVGRFEGTPEMPPTTKPWKSMGEAVSRNAQAAD